MKRNLVGAVLGVMLAVTCLGPLPARAEAAPVAEAINWPKILDLAACAAGIATIETGTGFVLAGIACGRAAANWWME